MTIVCSNWADRLPSAVTAVQLSSHMTSRGLPIVSMGSSGVEKTKGEEDRERKIGRVVNQGEW